MKTLDSAGNSVVMAREGAANACAASKAGPSLGCTDGCRGMAADRRNLERSLNQRGTKKSRSTGGLLIMRFMVPSSYG